MKLKGTLILAYLIFQINCLPEVSISKKYKFESNHYNYSF